MGRIGEIRKDPDDGEVARIDDVEINDDGDTVEVKYVVRTGEGEEYDNQDDESIEDNWNEHVLGPGEVWRIHKGCKPHWVGTDVVITGTSLDRIEWKVVRLGPLWDKDHGPPKKPDDLKEDEPLKTFLERFRFQAYAWKEDDVYPYQATEADREAVRKSAKERSEGKDVLGILSNLIETKNMVKRGENLELTATEFVEGLKLANRITPSEGSLREVVLRLGIEVPKEAEPEENFTSEQKQLALLAASALVKLGDKFLGEPATDAAIASRIDEVVAYVKKWLADKGGTLPTAKAPPKWERNQIRVGSICRLHATDDSQEVAFMVGVEYQVIAPMGKEEGRAQKWLVAELKTAASHVVRETWDSELVKSADGSDYVPPLDELIERELARPAQWHAGQVRRGEIRATDGSVIHDRLEYTVLPKGERAAHFKERYDWAVKVREGGDRGLVYGVNESWASELVRDAQKDQGTQQPSGQAPGKGTSEMSTTSKAASEAEEKVKAVLAALGGAPVDPFKDVSISHGGHQVVLPDGMTVKKGIEWLQRIDAEDEREVAINHEIECYPIEGAYALARGLKDEYGFVSLASTPGFFGPKPPVMVGFDISPTEHVQVPWGRMQIPGVEGYMETSAALKPNGEFRFVLSGKTKRRHEKEFNKLADIVRNYATKKSIYRGQAIRVKFPENPSQFDFTYTPKFIDTSKVREEELVFPADVQALVNTALYAPIEKTELCRHLQVPLKRGILFEGPFGVGKTLAAYVTAKKCVQNKWTFMYLDKTSDLKQAIQLARNYEPCVIFAEDIDRAVSGEERDEEMDAILNTIDGIDGKSSEIMVVLTTNNVGVINRALLRPGRLDCVIPVRAPDEAAARQLVLNYSRGLLRQGEDLTEVGNELRGMIPAVIRETVERAKLAAAWRLPEGTVKLDLTSGDLVLAARSMRAQLELMQPPEVDSRSDLEKAAGIIADRFRPLLPAVQNGHAQRQLADQGQTGQSQS